VKPDEQHDLLGLVRKASVTEERGVDVFDAGKWTDRERRRVERLIERGAGVEPGHFAKARENAALSAEIAKISREALALPPRVRLEERGSVTLPRWLCWDWMNRPDPAVFAEHLGLTVLVLSQLENGQGLTRACNVERDSDGEPVLLIDSKYGPVGRLSDERFGNWRDLLNHLAVNGIFEVDGDGTSRSRPTLAASACAQTPMTTPSSLGSFCSTGSSGPGTESFRRATTRPVLRSIFPG